MRFLPVSRPLFCLVVLLVLGCGGEREEASETINAQNGGSIVLNESRLVIPGNALENDTLVTLQIADIADHPALPGAHQHVLHIEPADLRLSMPGSLTLKLGGAAQEAGAVAYHLRDGVWLPVDGLEASGGGIEVSVMTLGAYAVVPKLADVGGNEIRGVVTWGNGDPAEGVPVEVLLNGSPLTQTESNSNGEYRIVDLAPGSYTIAVNFECTFEASVEVTADAPSVLDIALCQ